MFKKQWAFFKLEKYQFNAIYFSANPGITVTVFAVKSLKLVSIFKEGRENGSDRREKQGKKRQKRHQSFH